MQCLILTQIIGVMEVNDIFKSCFNFVGTSTLGLTYSFRMNHYDHYDHYDHYYRSNIMWNQPELVMVNEMRSSDRENKVPLVQEFL